VVYLSVERAHVDPDYCALDAMLATLSSRCSSKRHFDSWRSREQWLQQQLSDCTIPYVPLVNFRISRARQTMDEGGPENRDKFQTPGNFDVSTRRKSCPLKLSNQLFAELPEEIQRPASACGYYHDPEIPPSPIEEEPEMSFDFDEAAGGAIRKTKTFTTSSRHILGSVQRSMRKYTKNTVTEETPRCSEPKIPSVMKHYARGVSPDLPAEQIGGKTSPDQEPSTC